MVIRTNFILYNAVTYSVTSLGVSVLYHVAAYILQTVVVESN
jgi:hypothetical protein